MFIYLETAQKIESDAKLVMNWRNDAEALKMFYHSKPKLWDSFYPEYCNEYFLDEDLLPVFALYKGEKIGFLRFNKYKDHPFKGRTADMGVNLNPQKRGLGLGAAMIKKGVSHLFDKGYETIVAEVKLINTISIRAFERAGFMYFDSMDKKIRDTGEVISINRYIMHKTKQKNAPKKQGVFIIAEAGSNWHCGTKAKDLDMAHALIDAAAEAKADAVKFQTYKPETVYVPNAGDSDYLAKAGIKKSITEIFKDLSMPYEMIPQLAKYCEKRGIGFMSTPFSIADAKAVDPYVKIHKIASYEISHARLIEFLAKTGKPVILSTGAATRADIEWTINHFYKHGGKTLSLLQCTAKYPAPLSTLHLNVIPQLMNHFQVPVGLSDHSKDPLIGPVGAVAKGATIIEKHFTMNNKLPGPDHSFAIMPDELKLMVKAIRQMEQALGLGEKEVLKEENELKKYAQRAVQAITNIKKDEVLREGKNMDVLRPGKQKQGVHPQYLVAIEGKKATRNISLGDGIQANDFK